MADNLNNRTLPEVHSPVRTVDAIDRIYENVRAIRCLAVCLEYCVEKGEADGDGPCADYIEGQINAVNLLAQQIEAALAEINQERQAEYSAREAA